jgi:site-specific DNA-methyltransferase (cytosine-N4-specific)
LRDKQQLLIPARFAIAMQDDRWVLRNDMIWAKPSVPPRPERDRLRLSHEHFMHFAPAPRSGRAKYYYDLDGAEAGARDVVLLRAKAGRDGHSATFPIELVQPRIMSSCPPDGLVVDPFCGTGSALEAAILTGRRAHGIELSQSYARSARRNVLRARRQLWTRRQGV